MTPVPRTPPRLITLTLLTALSALTFGRKALGKRTAC
jgi:hypothetical protein